MWVWVLNDFYSCRYSIVCHNSMPSWRPSPRPAHTTLIRSFCREIVASVLASGDSITSYKKTLRRLLRPTKLAKPRCLSKLNSFLTSPNPQPPSLEKLVPTLSFSLRNCSLRQNETVSKQPNICLDIRLRNSRSPKRNASLIKLRHCNLHYKMWVWEKCFWYFSE